MLKKVRKIPIEKIAQIFVDWLNDYAPEERIDER
jgi:hypothetical protein